MGTISRLVSKFTSGGGGRRGGGAGGATPGGPGGAGGNSSQDAKIGRAVRTAVNKVTGKR